MSRPLLLSAFIGILLVALTSLAHYFGWYDSFSFFDKAMHGGAGVFTACALPWVVRKLHIQKDISFRGLLMGVLIIGLLWEGYEYAVQVLTGVEFVTLADSIADIVADIFGGVIGAFFVQNDKKRYNRKNAREE